MALALSSLFSFSPVRNLDPEGPLRPACNPEGDPANPMVNIGNRLWNRSLELGREANCCGLFFTIEHPSQLARLADEVYQIYQEVQATDRSLDSKRGLVLL